MVRHQDKVFGTTDCAVCSTLFTKASGSAKHCSEKCKSMSLARLRRIRLGRTDHELVCSVCTQSFAHKLKTTKTCSAECRAVWQKRKAGENYLLAKTTRLAKAKDYYAENRSSKIEYAKKYAKENREKTNFYKIKCGHKRRLQKKNFNIPFTSEQLQQRWSYFGSRCAYCGDSKSLLTMEHTKPLSRGGWHCLSNLRPACQPCNSSKGSKWPDIPKLFRS